MAVTLISFLYLTILGNVIKKIEHECCMANMDFYTFASVCLSSFICKVFNVLGQLKEDMPTFLFLLGHNFSFDFQEKLLYCDFHLCRR